MRKFLPLLLLVLVMVSSFALAEDAFVVPKGNYDDHVNDDGLIVSNVTDYSAVILPFIDRDGYYLDVNVTNDNTRQTAIINLRTEAYIPCYIKLEVKGNQGRSSAESFGPGAWAETNTHANYMLAFDNEIGGFVNEAWEFIGHGRNAEIRPGEGFYIYGCDIFEVKVFANDNFKYEVISAPLAGANNATLDLQMKSKVDAGDWGDTVTFDEAKTILIDEKPACSSLTALHQFRVPYLSTTAHGRYNGTVTFKAYTI